MAASQTGCPDNKYKASTWTKKLNDPREAERAVTQLEQLGDPSAIPALGQAWSEQGKPVRLLQVIISLARPLTPKEAEEKFFTDYKDTGRPASWDKALPFLKQALDEVDEANQRSGDSASKAAAALGEAALPDGLESMIKFTEKPTTKKLYAAQVDVIKAMGKFESEKARASAALIKVIDREPPDHPRTAKDKQDGAVLGEKYGLFLSQVGSAINSLGELRAQNSVKPLVLAMYRVPALADQLRRALVALGPVAEEELRKVLQGKHQEVNDLFAAKKLDKYCGDKNEAPPDQCQPVSMKDFYAAVVLGDFYDPKVVPDLIAALARPPLPSSYQDDAPSPSTQHNAIFDALRKIGSAEGAATVRGLWMGEKGKKDTDASTRLLAVGAYAFLTRDQQGVKELAAIAADNKAEDNLRQEAANAFARLATSDADIAVLGVLAKKYLDESNKRRKEADGKPKADHDAADKVLEGVKKTNDEAKLAALKATKDTSLTIEQIKAITETAKKSDEAFKAAKKVHKEKTSPYKQLDQDSKNYRSFARMFQTHAARIAVAIRCKGELQCYANTLKLKPDGSDSVKNLETLKLIKDENGQLEDLDKWSKEEKVGLFEGEVERAMLELGKAGPKAAQFTDALLDGAKSDNRLVRQSILLALPKIAKVPCANCEAKLDTAIKAGEGKVGLAPNLPSVLATWTAAELSAERELEGDVAVAQVNAAFASASPLVRWASARVCARLGSHVLASSYPRHGLRALVGDPEAVVRAAAIFALTSETFEGVRERQVVAIEADGDPLVRELFASRPRIDHPLLSPGESPCRVCDEPWHHS
ncbi:MAG: hypothetical protein H0T79_17445, partial [Deltaproteobacteria bacterium]|nr:hypothetical protein [Deltaproteobacteria bacterium]